jgi:penicillin-binding protein 1A
MTSAHCIFSNNGIYNEPIMIVRIEDRNGKVLYDALPKQIPIISPSSAFDVLKMMKCALGVVNSYSGKEGGTARRLRWEPEYGGFKNPIAGKTGTTQNGSDGWFIGHTPDLVTGIWVGNDDRNIHFKSGTIGQGARMAMPIWGYFMKAAYANKNVTISKGDFQPPSAGMPTVIECVEVEPNW